MSRSGGLLVGVGLLLVGLLLASSQTLTSAGAAAATAYVVGVCFVLGTTLVAASAVLGMVRRPESEQQAEPRDWYAS